MWLQGRVLTSCISGQGVYQYQGHSCSAHTVTTLCSCTPEAASHAADHVLVFQALVLAQETLYLRLAARCLLQLACRAVWQPQQPER